MCPGILVGPVGGGAHNGEKLLAIAQTVHEKIEFEKKIWRPLAAKPEVGVVT